MSRLITDYEINDEVRITLNAIAKKHDFENYYLEINDGSSKGDGYTGIVKSVKIFNANDSNKTLSLFVKISPREKNMREIFPIAELFHTEIYMYKTIFPCFKDLENQKGQTLTTFMPTFFGSLLNDENEVVILENLKENGYRLHDMKKPMNSEHIRLVISTYAKFHSLSLALRNRQPKMFENLQSKLYNSFAKVIDDFKNVLINKYTNILNVLNDVESKKMRNFLQNIEHEFRELINYPIDEYSVILHGDCWITNMLFKYLDESSSPVDVRLIDYQLSRLAPPVVDLASFFFICSSEQELKRCDEYLNLYYQHLSTHLQKLGCDPNKLYPYSVFQKQWKMFAKFCLITAPVVWQIMLAEEKDTIIDIEQSAKAGLTLDETFNKDTKHNEEFNSRFANTISYLVTNDLF